MQTTMTSIHRRTNEDGNPIRIVLDCWTIPHWDSEEHVIENMNLIHGEQHSPGSTLPLVWKMRPPSWATWGESDRLLLVERA